MTEIRQEVLRTMCTSAGVCFEQLEFLGGGREDSDGIVYTYPVGDKKMVLKIISSDTGENDMKDFAARLEFVHYLGENGVPISFPVRLDDGSLYTTHREDKYTYIAYIMNFCEGSEVRTDQLSTEFSSYWGQLIGKAHHVTKGYPVWKSLPSSGFEYGYQSEINFFINWCKDEDGKNAWADMEKLFAALPITRDCYGFIHNDNHQHNIIASGNDITLIDFDCATCHFFLNDITTPAQGIMFDISGGMCGPVYNPDPIKRYFDNFISGYEKENHLDDFWIKQIDLFISYRRLILFTCMQDYLNTNHELKQGFLHMIKEPAHII